MTADIDAKLVEAGRKLFAGDWRFAFASPSTETTIWRGPRTRRAAPKS